MIVYACQDDVSFEVDGAMLGRRGVVRVVRTIPGAQVLRSPKPFSRFREYEFCEFQVNGVRFYVEEEEVGGRFLVSPRDQSQRSTADLVRQAFAQASPMFGVLLRRQA